MVKILLIDQQQVTAQGVKRLLEDSGCVVIHVADALQPNLNELINLHNPALVLMDLPVKVDKWLGLKITLPFIAFTNIAGNSAMQALINSGIQNHISKQAPLDEIITGVNAVLKNEAFLCTHTRELLATGVPEAQVEIPQLSDREKEIILLIAEGKPDKDIADSLFLSYHTVRTHRKNISKKVGFSLKNAAELVVLVGMLNEK